MTATAQDIYQQAGLDFLFKRIMELPTEIFIPLFSDWAAENRIIPTGVSDYPGPFDKAIAPHLMEILDRLHPDDPSTHIYFMANAQSGKTVSVMENAIGAIIRYKLGSILFTTSSKSIAKIRGSFNIDTMIDNSGLAKYIKPVSDRVKGKTGDTTSYKEFAGGIKLLMTSYGSIADVKSNTFHYIFQDELDEAGVELKDQGDIEGILEGRTKGVRNFKILGISTPTRMETSRIYKNYLRGDQNRLFLPCPICGEPQILELKMAGKDYGLTFTREKNKSGGKILVPESVRYTCRYCKKDFFESKKSWMLENYEWRPQNSPIDTKVKSYRATGLEAPDIFLSWERICRDFINADFGRDIMKFKDFMINDLGQPWGKTENQKNWKDFKSRADNYCLKELPEGLIQGDIYIGPQILFGGVDVQGDRLELNVVAFGYGMESWEADYKIFFGDVSDINGPAWQSLAQYVYGTTYKINGIDSNIALTAVDTGYNSDEFKRTKDWGAKAHLVYNFVGMYSDRFIAVRGIAESRAVGLIKEVRINSGNLTKRYDCNVSAVKEMLINNIEIVSGPHSIHFPKYQKTISGKQEEIPDEHFKQFLSEQYQEISPKKYGWKKLYSRNEVWDTFIYARLAAEFNNLSSWGVEQWTAYYLSFNEPD